MSTPAEDFTLDGVRIVEGLRVWDYNLNRAVVGKPLPHGNPAERTWYDMKTVEGQRSSMMDGSRMWVKHPFDGDIA